MPEDATPIAHTLVDLLRRQAERYGDKVAFSFASDGRDEQSRLTYRDLDARARAIGASLQQQGAAGRRVLVPCPPGLDSVAAYFGCLYAGAVAVPVQDRLGRLSVIVPDARAGFVLASAETQAKIQPTVDRLVSRPLRWCAPDAGDAEKWTAPDVDAGTSAMMQYTSGSTRTPKGVVLTHRNLLHNLECIREAWGGDDRDVAVYWLPQHHDMGLIGGILEMIYVGCATVLMSPAGFITRPIRWLEAISRHRATMTAAPNFAYNLCVERSTPEERAALDLSSWSTAMNGAEPVQAATMRSFADAFAPAGFRPETFMPVYGLAEATLLVSGGSDSAVPVVRYLDRGALGEDRVVDAAPDDGGAVEAVGCGRPRGGQRVVVVDPETRRPRRPDEVGEIWIAGPSVAQGYRGKPEDTEQTFGGHLAGTGEGPFLRTGDLGFLRDGELFITGRCKDLIIIRGNHYYPNEIEKTVQACHPVLLSGRGAAFSFTPDPGGGEQLVVVQEVDRRRVNQAQLNSVVQAVGTAVANQHGVQAHTVILVEQMQIPTTSSGKIQRSRCRQLFLDGDLQTVAEWQAPVTPGGADPVAAAQTAALIQQAVAQQHQTSRRR